MTQSPSTNQPITEIVPPPPPTPTLNITQLPDTPGQSVTLPSNIPLALKRLTNFNKPRLAE